ncbi:MAG: DUF1624 domain-containing protein [Oscillospiraceae bacterium]|nr:DUF1624 domain-containing protein [Oscillospiraceae bacterium]
MQPQRYHTLDELRGLAVAAMVCYHALFLWGFEFGMQPWETLFTAAMPVQPFIAGTFIFLCGISCRFSRSNVKRGLVLAGIAMGVTAVTFSLRLFNMQLEILFGVLHFLAAAILLFTLLRRVLDKLPPWLQLAGFGTLFIVARMVMPMLPHTRSLVLFIVGVPSNAWFTADYFPLLPWVFLFLAGTAVGMWREHFPAWLAKLRCRPLAWLGRRAIWVYLAHQPVLMGLVLLWQIIFGRTV